jgi:hypothetical protein
MTQLAFIAAMALALGSTPTTAQIGAAQQQKADKAQPADQKKYCLEYDDTVGSRIAKQECHTRKEWSDRGVDLSDYLKK